jgi:hypothetical protein
MVWVRLAKITAAGALRGRVHAVRSATISTRKNLTPE